MRLHYLHVSYESVTASEGPLLLLHRAVPADTSISKGSGDCFTRQLHTLFTISFSLTGRQLTMKPPRMPRLSRLCLKAASGLIGAYRRNLLIEWVAPFMHADKL